MSASTRSRARRSMGSPPACTSSCRPVPTCRVCPVISGKLHCPTSRVALSCLLRCRAGRRVALPCLTRRPAGHRVALPCPRAALLTAALLPAPPCCSRHPAAARPAARRLDGRRPATRAPPCWQPHRCPHHPARAALLLRAALLADALLPVRRPAARAPPCWQLHCPALPTRRPALPLHYSALDACRSSLAMRRLSLPCALP
ncbi:unnamed protein product [Closterium sp. NIES-53]